MTDKLIKILESLSVCPSAHFGNKQIAARIDTTDKEIVLLIFLPGLCITLYESGHWTLEGDCEGQ